MTFTIKDRNLISEMRLRRRLSRSSVGSIVCKGKMQLTLAADATLAVLQKQAIIGLKLLAGTSTELLTVLSLGAGSNLSLEDCIIGRGCAVALQPGAACHIGSNTSIGDTSKLLSSRNITIGRRCAISFGVTIMDDDGHGISSQPYTKPVTIGDDVWIGCNSIILKGVTIGSGSVIAAGTLVNKSCPPNCLIGGMPGRVIRSDIQWMDQSRLDLAKQSLRQ